MLYSIHTKVSECMCIIYVCTLIARTFQSIVTHNVLYNNINPLLISKKAITKLLRGILTYLFCMHATESNTSYCTTSYMEPRAEKGAIQQQIVQTFVYS